ncbi:MAG: glycosyltransferase [Klebsiella huaxiensis]|uniref:glycosyltransferase n=1 Tax=Klebsiella huaxiensis TaxID=2153354 RepID=UPI0026EEDFCC|nr:glycosyltransferase [Klebsiella huaxiensis]WEJ92040.1 MAG: glycosyltransferase [Klebsiella huaxiensis]
MRIVIDLQGAQTESRFRGIGRYSVSIARAIIRNNSQHEVFIALSAMLGESIADVKALFADLLPPENIVIWHATGPVRAMDRGNEWRRESAELMREAFLEGLRPDVVFITSLFEGHVDDAVTSVHKFSRRYKVAVLHHDLIPLVQAETYLLDDVYKPYYLQKVEWLKNADLLLTNSGYTAQEAIEHLHLQGEHVQNIAAAADPQFCAADVSASEKETVLGHYGIQREFVLYAPGGFDSRKNFKRLIEAYAGLSDDLRRAHQLVIVSKLSIGDRQYLESLASGNGLQQGELVLTGYVPENELIQLYRLCKLFIFASLHEGFGLPVLEAMSCGAPAIGSNVTSIPEVIGNPDALFDPYSVTSIRKKITQCLTDTHFLARVKELAQQQAGNFSWDKAAVTALEAFEKIVAEEKNGVPSSPEALVQRILAISQGQAEDRDLRLCATAIDYNLKTTELYQLDDDALNWRVEGPFDSSYSLALVNREFARALAGDGVDVLLHSTEGPGDFAPDAAFMAQAENSDLLNFYNKCRAVEAGEKVDILSRNIYPPRVADMNARVKLLHCYAWEETGFPQPWIGEFNRELDGVLCTSEHVRKILIDNGLNVPAFVVGNGCDHWLNTPTKPGNKNEDGTFRFLHVSSCFPRKGVQAMLQAWGRAFTRRDNVSLIIKTFDNPHNEIDAWLAQAQSEFADYPAVEVIKADMSASELKGLYESCDVLVAPGCAEGFGLPIAEAMLSGLPAIVTNWSGQLDFVNSQNSWLMDYQFTRVKTHFGLFASTWASVDIDNLTAALKQAAATDKPALRKMADAGRQLILSQFTWAAVAQRSQQAVKTLRAHIDIAQHRARIGWLTTWNTKCGIATYSQHLVESAPQGADVIFAPQVSAEELVNPDEDFVLRNWIVGKENNYLGNLQQQIDALRLDVIVIQFNYGFFNHRELAAFIRHQHDAGRVVVMAMHSTVDPQKEPTWNFRLAEMADALALCDRLLVHSIADMNRLKGLGLTDNVALFPHGVINYSASGVQNKPQTLPLIASYGFCLPHKGLMELVESVHRLKQAGKPVRLRLVNAEYPVGESRDLVAELKAAAQRLGVTDLVEMHNDFLPDDESLRLLSEADLLIFAYQNTGESASGAVRYGMATQKPVAVTPLAIFDDLDDAVFKFDGCGLDDISQGIDRILQSIRQQDTWALSTQKRADAWREQHDYHAVSRRLVNMCQGLAKAKYFK